MSSDTHAVPGPSHHSGSDFLPNFRQLGFILNSAMQPPQKGSFVIIFYSGFHESVVGENREDSDVSIALVFTEFQHYLLQYLPCDVCCLNTNKLLPVLLATGHCFLLPSTFRVTGLKKQSDFVIPILLKAFLSSL